METDRKENYQLSLIGMLVDACEQLRHDGINHREDERRSFVNRGEENSLKTPAGFSSSVGAVECNELHRRRYSGR